MSLGPPLADLPDNKTSKDSLAELMSRGLAPYWLAAIIESADDAIISKTLDGVITNWNKGAERIFGYTAEEATGKPIVMLIPSDHTDEEPAILAQLRRGGMHVPKPIEIAELVAVAANLVRRRS